MRQACRLSRSFELADRFSQIGGCVVAGPAAGATTPATNPQINSPRISARSIERALDGSILVFGCYLGCYRVTLDNIEPSRTRGLRTALGEDPNGDEGECLLIGMREDRVRGAN